MKPSLKDYERHHGRVCKELSQRDLSLSKLDAPPLLGYVEPQTEGSTSSFFICCCFISHVRLFATLWIEAHQAPLFMGFPRQEYWSGLSFPSPRDLSDPGTELISPAVAGRFFTTESTGKSYVFFGKVSIQVFCPFF